MSIKVLQEAELESGWDDGLFVDAEESLLSQLRCSICYGVMRNASQCVQQHPFCHNCLSRAVELNRRCPVCKDSMSQKDIAPHRFIRTLVDQMKMKCENSDMGCKTVVKLEALPSHLRECEFRRLPCPNEGCPARMLDLHMAEHRKECPFELIPCDNPKCRAKVLRRDFDDHSCFEALEQMYMSKLEELRADFDRRENNLKRYVRMLLATSRAAPETMLNIEAILIAEEASVDVPSTTANGIEVRNGTKLVLPMNGPKLLLSEPISGGSWTWSWRMCGNSSFEFGVIDEAHKDSNGYLHSHGRTGFHSSSTCGSRLPGSLNVSTNSVVSVVLDYDARTVVYFVDGVHQLQQPLVIESDNGQSDAIGVIRLVATLWNGTRLERLAKEAIGQISTQPAVSPSATPAAATSNSSPNGPSRSLRSAFGGLIRRTSTSTPADPCPSHDHEPHQDRCRICTTCFTCTGYGPGCCVSGPGATASRAGQSCGCGPGRAGCHRCGRCDRCCQERRSITAEALQLFEQAQVNGNSD